MGGAFYATGPGRLPASKCAVSRGRRAPTAFATGAPQNARPDDSGLMISGSPGDRLFELKTWFGSYVGPR